LSQREIRLTQKARKVGDLYASFIDEAAHRARGDQANQGGATTDCCNKGASRNIGPLMGALLIGSGVQSPHSRIYLPRTRSGPRNMRFWLTQSGLGLPDRDYYLSDDAKLIEFSSQNTGRTLRRCWFLLGDTQAAKEAENILRARDGRWPRFSGPKWLTATRRRPTIRKLSVQLATLAPQFAWQLLLGKKLAFPRLCRP